jgi:YfiH family protein
VELPRPSLAVRLPSGQAWWTDRHGGVSRRPYATCNLGDHVGDDPEAVLENRRRVATAIGHGPPTVWCVPQQVHGSTVAVVREEGMRPVADGLVTDVPGLVLAAMSADCATVALFGAGAVGVAHAGWPGLLAGVIEEAVTALRSLPGSADGGPISARLGPCVRPAHYEFGADDLARVRARLGDDVVATTASGSPALDIPAAVRASLRAVDVHDFEDAGICTFASPDHFSYRREGITGRQAVVAVLDP